MISWKSCGGPAWLLRAQSVALVQGTKYGGHSRIRFCAKSRRPNTNTNDDWNFWKLKEVLPGLAWDRDASVIEAEVKARGRKKGQAQTLGPGGARELVARMAWWCSLSEEEQLSLKGAVLRRMAESEKR